VRVTGEGKEQSEIFGIAFSRTGLNFPITHTRITPSKPCVDPLETVIASSDARKAFRGVDNCTPLKTKTN